MFNMYQELVDRIEELLRERKKQEKLIKMLKRLYLKIPYETIVQLEYDNILTRKEKDYWLKLDCRRRMERKYVQNRDKNNLQWDCIAR